MTFVHAWSCTGGRPGLRLAAAVRRVGAKRSAGAFEGFDLRRRAIEVTRVPWLQNCRAVIGGSVTQRGQERIRGQNRGRALTLCMPSIRMPPCTNSDPCTTILVSLR